MADATAARLRRDGLAGRTVTLKVRFGDFRTITRSRTVPDPLSGGTDDHPDRQGAARRRRPGAGRAAARASASAAWWRAAPGS